MVESAVKQPENQSEKGPKKKSKIYKIIIKVIDYILIAFIAIIAVLEIIGFATKSSNFNVPNIGGYQFLTVATDSMAYDADGNEVYPVGIGLICKKVDMDEIAVGDDITFYAKSFGVPEVNGVCTITHRVFEIEYYTDTQDVKDFKCHGINVNSTNFTPSQTQVVTPELVLGEIVGTSQFMGNFVTAMQQWWVVLLLVIIPAGIIAVSSVIDIIKVKNTPEAELEAKYGEGSNDNTKPEDPEDPLSNISEEDRKALKEQMIKEMLESKKKGDK